MFGKQKQLADTEAGKPVIETEVEEEEEEDELTPIDEFVVETYGQELNQMGVIRNAAKNGHMAAFNALPQQQMTCPRVHASHRFYPKQWLTKTLCIYRCLSPPIGATCRPHDPPQSPVAAGRRVRPLPCREPRGL